MNLLNRKSSFMFFAFSFVLLFGLQAVCNAALDAEALADGRILITGHDAGDDIYRDTSPLQGRTIAGLPPAPPPPDKGLLWEPGITPSTSPWTDGDDAAHPTTDGTLYYYAVDLDGDGTFEDGETDFAIADRTPPSIENIAAVPSPFSPEKNSITDEPEGDGIEDKTRIFFTLTEATYVTLKIYEDDGTTDVKTLLDGTGRQPEDLLPPGDHFVEWDGSIGVTTKIVDPGRYLYIFDADDNTDSAGNKAIQSISGDVWVITGSFILKDISVTPTPFSPDGDKIRDITYISYEITGPADWVAGNIYSVVDGVQTIVAQVYAECLDYYWDSEAGNWVPFHVTNGIGAVTAPGGGLSTELYYLRPLDDSLGPPAGDPPFHVPNYGGLDTIAAYNASPFPTTHPNWVPVSFDIPWDGSGATDATTYIVRMEAAKSDGSKTLAKTHEIIIESPTITPNDKTAPLVRFTFPRADSVHSSQLSFVQAFLTDNQGTGIDLADCSIALFGPAGELIRGEQFNDGVGAITWDLQEALADDGSADGTYTIVVSTVDYARNRDDNLRFQFEYNMSNNDGFPPSVADGSPVAIDGNGLIIPFSMSTLIDISGPPDPVAAEGIVRIQVRICDGDGGSGIDLEASELQLMKDGMQVSPLSLPITYETESCGTLTYLISPLAVDGTSDGVYVLIVTSADVAGNTFTEQFSFIYRTVLDELDPSVESVLLIGIDDQVVPDIISYGPSNFDLGHVPVPVAGVRVRVEDPPPSSGIDVDNSLITLTGPNGPVTGQIVAANEGGVKGIDLMFDVPLADDGTDDGPYSGTILVADNMGNDSGEVDVEFTLGTFIAEPEAPVIVEVWPEDGAVINEPITEVYIVIEDRSGAGIDFEESDLDIGAPPGVSNWVLVSGELEFDEETNTITRRFRQSLATDGRSDGEYDIRARAYDNDGRRSERLRTTFTYDTQPPEVAAVEMGFRPWVGGNYKPITELRGGGTNMPLTTIAVKLTDALSDIDLDKSKVEISGISGEYSHDGVDTVIFDFAEFHKCGECDGCEEVCLDGCYEITITAVDTLGNSSNDNIKSSLDAMPYKFAFIYDTRAPKIECALAFDGDDVTLVEPTSTSSEVENCLITEPGQIPQVLGGMDRIKVKLKDPDIGVGVDVIASADALFIYGPLGQTMEGKRSAEGDNTLIFTFDEPFSTTDDSDDGIYIVKTTAVDLVGNMAPVEFSFEYKGVAPLLESLDVLLSDLDILTNGNESLSLLGDGNQRLDRSITEIRAVLGDRSGKGLDLGASFIEVTGPGVSDLDMRLNDGIDTISYIFAEPLANNGTDDGEYMIFVFAMDNAGQSAEYRTVFRYDTMPPEVVATVPADDSIINEPLSQVSATMDDAMSQVDLFASTISLSGPVSIASTQVNNGVDTIELRFFELASNGTADGLYQLSVNPVDVLGNSYPEPFTYSFIYDTAAPKVESTQPANGDVVTTPIDNVVAVLFDGGTGLALDACVLELIGPNGIPVSGQLSREESDTLDSGTLNFAFDAPLATDGSDDGTYTMRITTQDQAGNVGGPIFVTFTYVSRAPRIVSIVPADGSSTATPVSTVSVTLVDESGTGLDQENSQLSLLGPIGQLIAGELVWSRPDTMTYILGLVDDRDEVLATDGSDDGVYTLDIIAADNTGVVVNYKTTFVYDTTSPVVISTFPADDDVLSYSIDSVSAQLRDSGAGIDLVDSTIELFSPMGNLAGTQSNDGVNTIRYEFEPLPVDSSVDGEYVIRVTPVDLVGNSALEPFSFTFIYDTTAPVVERTFPAEGSTIVIGLDGVSVQLTDGNGIGLDLRASEVHLFDPSGAEVTSVKSDDGVDTLFLTFPALPADGSRDGEYTITIAGQDLVSNTSASSITFLYKALAPALVDIEVSSEDETFSLAGDDENAVFERSILQVSAILEDRSRSGSGLDFDATVINVEGPAVSDQDTIDNNGEDTITYFFAEPLANDGSDDGEYLVYVNAVDNDGQWAEYFAMFFYDTTAPAVISVTPDAKQTRPVLDDSPVPVLSDPLSAVTMTMSDALSGVDLFSSKLSLNGVNLRGSLSLVTEQVNDGVDTVALRFFTLPSNGSVDGLYEISADPVDALGNDLPEPLIFSFIYDTAPPAVVSTEPDSGEVVAVIERISVVLTDEFNKGGSSLPSVAGIDLGACTLELIGPDGESLNGELSREEPGSLSFELSSANGAPADGAYTIRIVTVDLAGNMSHPILIGFNLVTRAPVVVSTVPADGDQLRTPVSHVSATLLDNSSTGLNLEESMVTLIGPDGLAVPGTHSSSDLGVVTLTLDNPLATDASDDGVYALDILAVDNSGVSVSYRTAFTYDTTPPVVILTSPADGHMTKEDIGLVSAQLADSGSGVNLEISTISLSGPIGIAGDQVNDGVDTIKYEFAPLSGRANANGQYIISIIPVDVVGNAPPEAQTFSFTYDTIPPAVERTKPADGSTVVVAVDSVSVQMDDGNGVGADVEASSIRLRGPDGRQIDGTTNGEGDTLVLTFPALAIDGSDNGTYSAAVILRDKLGNASEEYSFQFTYLPTAPSVVTLTPADGSFTATPVEVVAATLLDKSGSGIDFDSSWIRLLGPDGQEVPGQLSNDGTDTLFFHPQDSFATDGTSDGEYIVEIQVSDNEMNTALLVRRFSYDTTPASISRVYVGDSGNGITLETHAVIPSDFGPVTRVSAVIDDAGVGVDLNLSSIQLFNPLGMMVNAEQQNDGVNTISLQIDPLIQPDGPYAMFVIPVDKLGNVLPQEKLFSFTIDTAAPEIVASTPTMEATVVNSRLQEVSIRLSDGDGAGIDANMSVVQVSGPNGEISGELEVQCSEPDPSICTLLYRFDAPLSLDASDDGEYVVKVWFADVAGNGNMTADGLGEPAVVYFTFDTMQPGGPVISNVGVFPKAFSPNGDGTYDDTTISYVLSKDAKVELLIYSSNRTLVATLLNMEPRPLGMNSITWDGVVGGSLLPDGIYLIKIDAVDDQGLTGVVESSSVVIDTRPPSIDRPLVSNNPFTPDGDGFADAAVISFAVNGSEPEDSVEVAIYDQTLEKIVSLGLDRPFRGDGEYSATWDGEGADIDGEYTFIITAQDAAGNIREISGAVAMDRAGPVIRLISPSEYILHTNQSPVVLSGTANDWGGVRSVSVVAAVTPAQSAGPVQDLNISNWTKMTFSGDKIDNDVDGNVDEEEFNDKDDDGDGLVDEDLVETDGRAVNWIHHLVPPVDGEYEIRFRASDPIDHDAIHPESLRVVYDTTPPLHVSTEGDSASSGGIDSGRVRDGDFVTIVTTWDESGYNVTADFAELDSNSGEPVKARDRGDGQYTVDYDVSEGNSQPNGLKTITITAEDEAGNKTVLDSFGMKLRNGLPTILSVSSPGGLTSYPNGSTV
ncbi:Ig-like domain-containing protein, partial [Candidatus Poribacteria bacterium]